MEIELYDCTLRDGGSVVGGGVGTDVTREIVSGLAENGVKRVEIGNTYSMGEAALAKCVPGTPSDEAYMKAVEPLAGKIGLGMYFQPKFGTLDDLERARAGGMTFVRIGANIGEVATAEKFIRKGRDLGLETRYSLMKGWAAPAEALAADARAAEAMGAQVVHIMDSTGSFLPDEVTGYCETILDAIAIPLGFHGHNNLGLAVANALAAYRAGAKSVDCSLCGFARSAGNSPTEMMAVVFSRMGVGTGVDPFAMLDFAAQAATILRAQNFVPALDVLYGMAGFHSGFLKSAKAAAEKTGKPLQRIIWEVCLVDKMNPSDALFMEVAERL